MKDADINSTATQSFRFLVEEFGFQGPVIESSGHTETRRYTGDSIGVEVELDWHERTAFVLLVRTNGTRWPEGYYVDRSGRKCRMYLEEHARRQRLMITHTDADTRAKPSTQRMVQSIVARAALLRDALPSMVKSPEAIFP